MRAAQLFGAVAAVREVLGAARPQADRASYESAVAAVRSQLGDVVFNAAWVQGRMLEPEQAIS
jgi:hypothetical protein